MAMIQAPDDLIDLTDENDNNEDVILCDVDLTSQAPSPEEPIVIDISDDDHYSSESDLTQTTHSLLMLLHAHKCKTLNLAHACAIRGCDKTRDIMDHMRVCRIPNNCQVENCSRMKQIISHWKICCKDSCPSCGQVKRKLYDLRVVKPSCTITRVEGGATDDNFRKLRSPEPPSANSAMYHDTGDASINNPTDQSEKEGQQQRPKVVCSDTDGDKDGQAGLEGPNTSSMSGLIQDNDRKSVVTSDPEPPLVASDLGINGQETPLAASELGTNGPETPLYASEVGTNGPESPLVASRLVTDPGVNNRVSGPLISVASSCSHLIPTTDDQADMDATGTLFQPWVTDNQTSRNMAGGFQQTAASERPSNPISQYLKNNDVHQNGSADAFLDSLELGQYDSQTNINDKTESVCDIDDIQPLNLVLTSGPLNNQAGTQNTHVSGSGDGVNSLTPFQGWSWDSLTSQRSNSQTAGTSGSSNDITGWHTSNNPQTTESQSCTVGTYCPAGQTPVLTVCEPNDQITRMDSTAGDNAGTQNGSIPTPSLVQPVNVDNTSAIPQVQSGVVVASLAYNSRPALATDDGMSFRHLFARWHRRHHEIRVHLTCLNDPAITNATRVDMYALEDMGLGWPQHERNRSTRGFTVLPTIWGQQELDDYFLDLFPALQQTTFHLCTIRRGGRIIRLPDDCLTVVQLRDYFLSERRQTTPKIYIRPDTRLLLSDTDTPEAMRLPTRRRFFMWDRLSPNNGDNGSYQDDDDDDDGFDRTIKVKRADIVSDLLREFKDPAIVNKAVRIVLEGEEAEDAGGVFRDVLSDFWSKLIDAHFTGNRQAVPVINSVVTGDAWVAVGRILYKGYQQEKYMPLRFCQASLAYGIFHPDGDCRSMLLNSFLEYLDEQDRDTVKKALDLRHCALFSDNLVDALIDLMSKYDMRSIPTPANVRDQIMRCAEIALWERPCYPLMQMNLKTMRGVRDFCNVLSLELLFKRFKPDGEKLSGLLVGKIRDPRHEIILSYLKRAVQSFSEDMVCRFLRFTTGSDIMNICRIDVEFVSRKGLERRFVSHTCGPSLDVPSTYDSYEEFESELTTQLSSDYWQMDFM